MLAVDPARCVLYCSVSSDVGMGYVQEVTTIVYHAMVAEDTVRVEYVRCLEESSVTDQQSCSGGGGGGGGAGRA